MRLTILIVFLALSVAVLEAARKKPAKKKPAKKPAKLSCKGADGKSYAEGKGYTKKCAKFTCEKVKNKGVMKEEAAEGCCSFEDTLYTDGAVAVNETQFPGTDIMCCGGEWKIVQELNCCKFVEISSRGGARMEDLAGDRETHGSIFGQYTQHQDVLARTNQWKQQDGDYIMYYDTTWQSGGYWRVGLDTSTSLLRSMAPPTSCPNMASAWEYSGEFAGSLTQWYPDYTFEVKCVTPGKCDDLSS